MVKAEAATVNSTANKVHIPYAESRRAEFHGALKYVAFGDWAS